MSARLHLIVEGQTEETFVNLVLAPHLAIHSVWADARCVMTCRKRRIIYRGGMTGYAMAKKDMELWMKEDQNPNVYFTTMFDLYALSTDFPDFEEAKRQADPYSRVEILENAIRQDLNHPRFIPYIQLYEYETLIFADPQKLDWEYIEHDQAINNLIQEASSFASPELINDTPDKAPSKRIIREIPEYEGMKASAGPLVVEKIGLTTVREKCAHFNTWISRLETLP